MFKNLVYLLIGLTLFASCNEETFDYSHPDVKLYIKQLKAGNYASSRTQDVDKMPAFTVDDIPVLLEYTNDFTIIPSFPLALASNDAKLRLAECVLWTIESIRLGRAASWGSKLVYANADNYEGIYFLSDEDLSKAIEYYRRWWEKYTNNPDYFRDNDPCLNDPLCGTPYMWW